MAWQKRATAMLALALLSLAACTSSTPEDERGRLDGETIEIGGEVRLTLPDGWTVQTAETSGWAAYLATVVPEGTTDDEVGPDRPRADFAHLVLTNIGAWFAHDIGPGYGPEDFAAEQLEADRANTRWYPDIDERDPVMLGERTFYGYEGILTADGEIKPFQYWYGSVHGSLYKFEIFGDDAEDAAIPQDLVDVMLHAEFIDKGYPGFD